MSSGDSATDRAARLASSGVRAPLTTTRTNFVAPSPSSTMARARLPQTEASAAATSSPEGVTPEAPFASTSTVSFVLHSPSTVMALKESLTAAVRAFWRRSGATTASVVTKASIVAMSGAIIPAPLAIPPSRQPSACDTAAVLRRVSVVRMASAAAASSGPRAPAASAMPLDTRSMARKLPILPVEHTSASAGSTPVAVAASAAVSNGWNTSMSQICDFPCTTMRFRSSPAPVSMLGFGNGTREPSAR